MEQKLTKPVTSDRLSQKGTLLHLSSLTDSVQPTVVLIHFSFGSHRHLFRHVEMFNELGHSCVTFNLFAGTSREEPSPFRPIHKIRFLYTLWVQQIRDVLDSIEGPKIVFSMSFPSYAGLIASSGRSDVVKYICDGGPFAEVVGSIYRLYHQQRRFSHPLWGTILSVSGFLYLGPFAPRRLQAALSRWSPQVPILSLRGGKDQVVPPRIIDAVFAHHKNLDVTGFEIAEAGHLDGLKRFPEIYSEKVREFLMRP